MTHQPQMPQPGHGAPRQPNPGIPAQPPSPPIPGYGLPGRAGGNSAPQPPTPPRRRTALITTVALAVVTVLIGGGYLAWSKLSDGENAEAKDKQRQKQGQSQGRASDRAGEQRQPGPRQSSIPELVKSAPDDLLYDAKATAAMFPASKRNPASYPEFKNLTQIDSIYRPKTNWSIILGVHVATGKVSDPAQRIETAFSPNEMAIKPKDYTLKGTGAGKAVLRCGVVKDDTTHVPMCVWADNTTVGDVLGLGTATSPTLQQVDLDTLAQQTNDLRNAIHTNPTN